MPPPRLHFTQDLPNHEYVVEERWGDSMRLWMKSTAFLAVGLLALSLAGCDLFSDDGPPTKGIDIPLGAYEEFGKRTLVNDTVVSVGIAGVYFQRVFRFKEEQQITISVFSDFRPEVGIAQGRYLVDDEGLLITVESSTSSYYEQGESVHYNEVEVVDDTFTTTFHIGGHDSVFQGPGLILTQKRPDKYDADNDGNTSETLRNKQYFALAR